MAHNNFDFFDFDNDGKLDLFEQAQRNLEDIREMNLILHPERTDEYDFLGNSGDGGFTDDDDVDDFLFPVI